MSPGKRLYVERGQDIDLEVNLDKSHAHCFKYGGSHVMASLCNVAVLKLRGLMELGTAQTG